MYKEEEEKRGERAVPEVGKHPARRHAKLHLN
jgi:hypothetical protein